MRYRELKSARHDNVIYHLNNDTETGRQNICKLVRGISGPDRHPVTPEQRDAIMRAPLHKCFAVFEKVYLDARQASLIKSGGTDAQQ